MKKNLIHLNLIIVEIKKVIDFIDLMAKQINSQYFTPEEKVSAVNSASNDLFIEQLRLFRQSGRLPELLQVFEKRETFSVFDGVVDISVLSDYAEATSFTSVVSNKEYPGDIKRTSEEFISRSINDIIPDIQGEKSQPDSVYLQESEFQFSDFVDGKVELSENFLESVALYLSVDEKHYNAKLLDNLEWADRFKIDLLDEKNLGDASNVSLQSTTYDFRDKSFLDLPSDYIKAKSVSIINSCGKECEAEILSVNEFNNRTCSALLAPTEENPIARVQDDKLFVLPQAKKVNLYYWKHPVRKRTIGRVIDNSLEIEPKLTNNEDVKVKFVFYQYPVFRRPIGFIENKNFRIAPLDVTLINLYYLKKPTDGNYGYVVSGEDYVFSETGGINGDSVDLEWSDIAFSEITTRALTYLGITLSDPDITQVEAIKERLDSRQ
jgi:hypothetical protein